MLSEALYGLAHVCDQRLTKSSRTRSIASHDAGNAGIVSKLCRRVYKREKNSEAWFRRTAEELVLLACCCGQQASTPPNPGSLRGTPRWVVKLAWQLRPAIPSGVVNTVCWHLTLRVSYGFPRGMPCFPRKVARLHRAACHGQGCCLPLCGNAS